MWRMPAIRKSNVSYKTKAIQWNSIEKYQIGIVRGSDNTYIFREWKCVRFDQKDGWFHKDAFWANFLHFVTFGDAPIRDFFTIRLIEPQNEHEYNQVCDWYIQLHCEPFERLRSSDDEFERHEIIAQIMFHMCTRSTGHYLISLNY